MWTVLFPCFFMAKKIQSNWWILIHLALASGRHCWQVEDSRGSTTCGHHAEWHQCLLCAETLWQWTSHGRDRGIFWEASWMCFVARFLFFLPFMNFHGTTKITKYIQSWRVRFGIWVYYPDIFEVPVFFRFKIQCLVFKRIVILGLADWYSTGFLMWWNHRSLNFRELNVRNLHRILLPLKTHMSHVPLKIPMVGVDSIYFLLK